MFFTEKDESARSRKIVKSDVCRFFKTWMWFRSKTKMKDITALDKACKFNLTYYDSAYVAEALSSKKILVTDDKKLAKAAENAGVKTLTSRDLTK